MFGQSLLSGAFGTAIIFVPDENFSTKLYTGSGTNQLIGGKLYGSGTFNGTSSGILLRNGDIGQTQALTISAWIYMTAHTATRHIVSTYDYQSGPSKGYTFVVTSGGNLQFSVHNGDCNNPYPVDTNCNLYTRITSPGTIPLNQWVHVAVSMGSTGNSLTLYIDGTSVVSTITQQVGYYNINTRIGYTTYSVFGTTYTEGYFLGNLDQIRFYNSALTGSQINELYTETTTTANTLDFPTGAGCVAGYTLDNSANNIINTTTDVSTCNFPTGAGCVALYEFEDNANDTCGTYNGTASNVTYENGLFSKAAVFNGTNSEIGISSSAINPANVYSVSMWVNFDNASAYTGFFCNNTSAFRVGEITIIKNTATTLQIFSGGQAGTNLLDALTAQPESGFVNNVWYHIVVVSDRSIASQRAKVFVNGIECSYTSYGANQASVSTYSDTKIGLADGQYFPGKIDQVRIFNGNLTSSQITELARGSEYNGESNNVTYNGFIKFQPDLVWLKQRGGTTWHNVQDTLNGPTKHLYTNATNSIDTTATGLTSFDLYGFTLGGANGFNGSNQSMVAWNWKAGADTYAGAFNGSSSYIDTNTTFSPTLMSFSAWVYPTSISHGSWYARDIISNRNGNTGNYNGIDFGIVTGTGNLYTRFSDGSNQGNASSNTVPLQSDAWTHVAFTVNTSAGEAKVYKNGSLEYTVSIGTGSQIATGNDFYIGRYWNTANDFWNGKIDQARIFNTALSASEVTSLYNETASNNDILNFPAGAGCVAAYTFNKTANDLSGNYNGTASNVTYVKPGYTGRNNDGSIESQVSANQDAGFSIVSYNDSTGSGTVGHGLKSIPQLIIQKAVDISQDWYVYIPPGIIDANYNYLVLNSTAAKSTTSSTPPTATTFNPVSSGRYIAYLWHSVANYSKIGTYTATQTAGSPTITTDFEPAWVMLKNVDRNQEWVIIDSERGNNPGQTLRPESDAAEYAANSIIFNSTGFVINTTGQGNNYATGETFIYMAFAK